MDNDFFLNAGIPPTWHQSLSSSPMNIQPSPQDSFYNNNTSTWEKSTTDHHHALQFDSALSSLVSSPSASNSNSILPTNDNFAIRELIGKLGNIGAPSSSSSYINGNNNNNNSTNTSCYSTPLSSPPKINMIVNSSVAEFSTDPGFAERAAKFSCFGSRSFNGRTNQLGLNNSSNNNNGQLSLRSTTNPPLMENGKLARVSSSPSLKALAGSQSQIGVQENKNSPLMDNSQEESTISEQTLNAENAGNNTNSRKRKASSKGKAKEASTSANPNPKVMMIF